MIRFLHDDWSIRLGENRSDQPLKHLAAMLNLSFHVSLLQYQAISAIKERFKMDGAQNAGVYNKKEFWSESNREIRMSRLLTNDLMSDITFVVKQKRFPAHKFVLAFESEVFHAMFYGPMADDKKEIEIEDCENPDDFLEFLSLIYNKKANVTWKNIEQLSYLRKKYMINVEAKLFSDLLNNFDPIKWLKVLQICVTMGEKEMIEKCMTEIRSKLGFLVKTKEFLLLDQPSLKVILEEDQLDISEIDLFKAVDKWCSHQVELKGSEGKTTTKREVLGDALYYIRFPILHPQDFAINCGDSMLLTDKEYRELNKAIWSRNLYGTQSNHISGSTIVAKFPIKERTRLSPTA